MNAYVVQADQGYVTEPYGSAKYSCEGNEKITTAFTTANCTGASTVTRTPFSTVCETDMKEQCGIHSEFSAWDTVSLDTFIFDDTCTAGSMPFVYRTGFCVVGGSTPPASGIFTCDGTSAKVDVYMNSTDCSGSPTTRTSCTHIVELGGARARFSKCTPASSSAHAFTASVGVLVALIAFAGMLIA